MYDKKYKLRYLPLFYEDLNEKITYIVEKLKIPKLPVTCWIKLRKPYWTGFRWQNPLNHIIPFGNGNMPITASMLIILQFIM